MKARARGRGTGGRARAAGARAGGGRATARARVMRRFIRGKVQAGVRWKTSSRSTRGWISGMSWAAEQPVPMTATRSPVRSWSWFQRAEWKRVPAKRLEAGDVRQGRVAERAHPGDEDLRLDVTRGGLDRPALARVVPVGAGHLVAEADARRDVVLVGAAPDVGPDLLLGGVDVAPVRVRRERVRVEVRLDVDRAARIAVVAPRAPEVLRALEDLEVVDAGLPQADRHAEPGKPGADDGDPHKRSLSAAVTAEAAGGSARRTGARRARRGS